MFEAKLQEAGILRKILEAIKDLLTEATFDCTETGIYLQAMDNSHVSLVSLNLWADGFERYRCDRNISLGMNLTSLAKILKCSNNEDIVTSRAQDVSDIVTFVFEDKNEKSVSEFDMKLMNLDQDHLGIPDTDYDCVVKMPSAEFARIVRDLTHSFGESITISCSKNGIKFASTGDIGTGNIKVKQNSSVEPKEATSIRLQEPVTLSFAARYLNMFAKASGLSEGVQLSMSQEVPLVVEFKLKEGLGYIRYYLAPKIEDVD